MMHDRGLGALGLVAGQEAAVPALRAALVAFALLAAIAWARQRPRLALLTLSLGGFLGLGYWLVQISSPLGLGTDPALTEDWAQAGVNARAEPKQGGFVVGTEPGTSMVSSLASAGVPFSVVVLVPQLSTLLTLGLLTVLPFAFLKNRATAAFAACIALGGGLWPGSAPFGSMLLRPAALVVAGALAGMVALAARGPKAARAFHRVRWSVAAAWIAGAVLARALGGGVAPGAAAALLVGATIALASPLRAALRSALHAPVRTRRAEALLLLCVFCGSGLLWWDPRGTVAGFDESRGDNSALRRPLEWIERNVPATSVVLASPAYSAPIAALAGRRVLFPPLADGAARSPLPEPFRRARLAETARRGQPVARLAEAFSVTHLFLGPGEPDPPVDTPTPESGEPRLDLVLEYRDAKDFRVFRLVKK